MRRGGGRERGERGTRCNSQEAQKYKEWVTRMAEWLVYIGKSTPTPHPPGQELQALVNNSEGAGN